MLALARLLNLPITDYINPDHSVQQLILETLSEVCTIEQQKIILGTDGCSVPTFAVPLQNTASAYAHLCDPCKFSNRRASGCQTITSAMLAYPEMVAGPGRFDTYLMQVAKGRIIAKNGSEGYQGIGILPGVLYPDSPGIGIAIKIADGDRAGRVRSAVALEVLRQIGALSSNDIENLRDFGITRQIRNWREIVVGESKPCFTLQRSSSNTTIEDIY
jgi:L-asparaginase II